MNPPTTEQTQSMHHVYNLLSGLAIPFSMSLHFRYEMLIAQGMTADDLGLVINYVKRRIREKRRERESLLPRNILRDYSNFQEDLSMARAEQRSQLSPRDTALKALGRPVEASKPARSVADILAGEKAFKELLALKERL